LKKGVFTDREYTIVNIKLVDEAIANSSLCKAEEIVGTLPSTKSIYGNADVTP